MTGDPTPDTPPDTPKPKPGLRDAQGRILPGSGKSGGRKVGSKNKPSPIEGMLLGKEPELAKALVHWVEQGNSAAITVVFRYPSATVASAAIERRLAADQERGGAA